MQYKSYSKKTHAKNSLNYLASRQPETDGHWALLINAVDGRLPTQDQVV